tara:strand:+ start:1696 stop:2037 length:342 start_codon:yes stop_codon:yes gene_type:complete
LNQKVDRGANWTKTEIQARPSLDAAEHSIAVFQLLPIYQYKVRSPEMSQKEEPSRIWGFKKECERPRKIWNLTHQPLGRSMREGWFDPVNGILSTVSISPVQLRPTVIKPQEN